MNSKVYKKSEIVKFLWRYLQTYCGEILHPAFEVKGQHAHVEKEWLKINKNVSSI